MVDVEGARRQLQFLIHHYTNAAERNEQRGDSERAFAQNHFVMALVDVLNYLDEDVEVMMPATSGK